MSYQVLARKWRPKSFEELVGQKQTAKALINALESQRLHHAYLFTGTRGVGKTTIARILSKSLNCEKGITSHPCGECSSCIEIDQGNFVDLMEIDAASKTKVEDTRELLDNVQYRPTRGRYKVYLIDEVHMLSGHSFNALLKTLEEPPPHVVFLLATTDPQKLPVTVLSRCLQFHLKRMEQPQIVDHLAMILTEENIEFTKEALLPIAKGADGSMRDALSLLDQAIAFSGEKLELSSILEMLGSIDQSYCFQILAAIQQDDATGLMDIIQQMSQYSPDYFEVMSDWLSLLHSIAVAQATGNSEDNQITELAQTVSPADLQLYYQLSLQAKKDMPFAPHPRQGFEMAFLRVLAFRPNKTPGKPAKKKLANTAVSEGNTKTATHTDNNPTHAGTDSDVVAEQGNQSDNKIRLVASNGEDFENQPANSASWQATQNNNQALKMDIKTSEPLIEYPAKTAVLSSVDQVINEQIINEQAKSVSPAEKRSETKADNLITASKIASGEAPVSGSFSNEIESQPVPDKRLYPEVERIAFAQINFDNWHYAIDQMPIAGNGVQVLLNSLACFEGNLLKISHLSKVTHFLTDNLRQSIQLQIREYFADDGGDKLALEFISVDALPETPKQKQIKKYEEDIEKAYQNLTEDPCVAQLQRELGATIDKQSICLN